MSKPLMDESDIADEMANLRAERNCLLERLRQTSTTREIVGELRTVQDFLHNGNDRQARRVLSELLRRLDESQ